MSKVESYIENLQKVIDFDGEHAEEFVEEELLNDEMTSSLEAGLEALSFCQSLWQTMKANGLVSESEDVDFYVLEKVYDSILGELAAAAIFAHSIDTLLGGNITEAIEQTGRFLQNESSVPPEVIDGFGAFSARVKNVSSILKEIRDEAEKIS